MAFVRDLASLISRRSAALMAGALFALWELRQETEAEAAAARVEMATKNNHNHNAVKGFENGGVVVSVTEAQDEEPQLHHQQQQQQEEEEEQAPQRTKVAFNGSVMERYPGYRARCQGYLDALVARSGRPGFVDLVPAVESSLLGAAVALASADAVHREQEAKAAAPTPAPAPAPASAPVAVVATVSA